MAKLTHAENTARRFSVARLLRIEPRFAFLPSGKEAGGLLPWVIGVMMYLCTLAILSGAGLSLGIDRWATGLNDRLTIQILHPERPERERQRDAALEHLRDIPGIARAEPVDDATMNALLAPWLGRGNHVEDLPVPVMIDVRLQAGGVDVKALAASLRSVAPNAELDDHQRWLARLKSFAAALQLIALGVVAMVVLCTIAIVIFGVRAGLASHRDHISIMHLMGAEDQLIAGHFQFHYWKYGLKGSAFGVFSALATGWILDVLARNLGDGLLPALGLKPVHYLPFILLPLLAATLTQLTARVTVHRALGDLV